MVVLDGENAMAALQKRMAKSLKGFKSGLPPDCDPWSLRGGRSDPRLFPVPELVLFALRDVMGFSWSGRGEKVRWSVYATVEGEPFIFESRKFGFAIDHREELPAGLLKRVEGQLSSSLRLLEPLLNDVASAQIANGNLTLENRFAEFDNRYRFFRTLADKAFQFKAAAGKDADGTSERTNDTKVFSDLTERLNQSLKVQQEGYFASGAMVDAYFSRLEHRVLLLRAFIGRPLEVGDFETFLQKTWEQRLREVVPSDINAAIGKLLGELRDVKSSIRNPLAHGGVENDGGAFYFHMPSIGAIPANLSRYRGRLKTSFFPIADRDHAEICALFDDFDELLETGALELPNEFVKWGIDPQFDKASIDQFGCAVADGPEAVSSLIEALGRAWEQHANFE